MDTRSWMRANLKTQGYGAVEAEDRRLWLGVRFSTGLCLALVVIALVLQSVALLSVLVVIGAVAGFASRHPFDHLWNHGVRHLARAPKLPPSPPRRRDAFRVATAMLAAVTALFALGATAAALVVGAMLVAACTLVTAANLCLPSEAFAWWERRKAPHEAVVS